MKTKELAKGSFYLSMFFFLLAGVTLLAYYSYYYASAKPIVPAYSFGSYFLFKLDLLILLWASLLAAYLTLSYREIG